jgi:hypothetical protein
MSVHDDGLHRGYPAPGYGPPPGHGSPPGYGVRRPTLLVTVVVFWIFLLASISDGAFAP